MKNVRVARRYALALMGAAEDQKALDRTTKDLALLEGMLKVSRELRLLLVSPIISVRKKAKVFKELLGERVGAVTMTFVNLMISRNREAVLGDVIGEYSALLDERMGIVNVDVKAAIELVPLEEGNLQAALEKYTRKKVRIRFTLDKAIKGGLVVKIGDTVLDGSVRRQLELLRERFAMGSPLSN
jgi:F-type H+-transporting ATPase subunit delta